MKGIFLTAAVIVFFVTTATCQITQGNWLVGGSASFSSTKYSQAAGPTQGGTVIQAMPNIGYFFWDKFAGGLALDYNFIKELNGQKITTFGVGPFLRYYFLPSDNTINVFVQPAYQYFKYNGYSQNTISLSAGPVVYFNENVGIEFTVGYYVNNTNSVLPINTKSLQIGLGFQIHLKK